LIKGSRGAFEVAVDGDVLFSKHQMGRFPDPGEIATALAPRLGPSLQPA
jgi:selT/selW/selH-like putative selenoprotein